MKAAVFAAALLASPVALTQDAETRIYPHLSIEVDLGLYGVTTRADRLPTENYIEASVGREIGGGFGVDVGYQYGRYPREEAGGLGTSHAILFRLGWTAH